MNEKFNKLKNMKKPDATKVFGTNYLCGCKKKGKVSPDDVGFDTLLAARPEPMVMLPPVFSLKDKFPKVYCQNYGDCTANATCACDDYYYHNKPGWMPSTVFTYYNCKAPKDLKDDDGSTVEEALKKIKKYGVCSAKVWPNTMPWNQKPSPEAYENGLKGKEITKHYRLKNLLQLKQALYKGYPCPGAVEWAFRDYDENFVLNDPTKADIKEFEDRWHAILFVGYDDINERVEIRNSWGTGWCNNGYGYITYKSLKKLIGWDDTYAVTK